MTAIVNGVVTRLAAAVTGCLRLFAAFNRVDNAIEIGANALGPAAEKDQGLRRHLDNIGCPTAVAL